MKYNIQIKIIYLINKIFKKIKLSKKTNDFKEDITFEGILEWDEEINKFFKVDFIKNIKLENLYFLDSQKKILIDNTKHFLEGGTANNALLWGSRGTGKSSLVLATYNYFKNDHVFAMIEIKFFQIKYLPKILRNLEKTRKKIIIYCDDFSFESNNENFIIFKNTLEGSLRKYPNIIFYVTSNYRHLVKNIKNNNYQETHNKDTNENLVSLSDRFGIWLGFHNFDEEKFLKVVFNYAKILELDLEKKTIKERATQWAILRGSYSGREALNLVRFLKSENS